MLNTSFRPHPGLSALCKFTKDVYLSFLAQKQNAVTFSLTYINNCTFLSSLHKNNSSLNCIIKLKKCFIAWLTGKICNSMFTCTNPALQDFHGGLRALHSTTSKWIKKSLCVVLNATIHPQGFWYYFFCQDIKNEADFQWRKQQGKSNSLSVPEDTRIILISYQYQSESHDQQQHLSIFLHPSTVKVWQDVCGSWSQMGTIIEKTTLLMNKLFHFLTKCFLKIKLKTKPLLLKLILSLLFPCII